MQKMYLFGVGARHTAWELWTIRKMYPWWILVEILALPLGAIIVATSTEELRQTLLDMVKKSLEEYKASPRAIRWVLGRNT